ncbi:putative amidoligase domain-containing protein [Evansella tamaricis]|uniref:Uncharacterized protein n=1 Tax=Evansella tamaricis TaxID=2069301 RepID=A0ABS6JQ16_9BACI|nr:hypothetical protein [Evansella tamaricis]MBU9714470.1 hypothetical protein [Evansella tamaricis]
MVRKSYELHGIKSMQVLENATQLIVEGSEFYPHKIAIKEATGADRNYTHVNRTTFSPLSISKINQYYLGQEMLDTAIMTAYYCHIRTYSVHVQRIGKEIGVISVRDMKQRDITATTYPEKEPNSTSLLGADLEVMIWNKTKQKFVAIPMSKDGEKKKIGADRALLRKGTAFYQPIIELRAVPKATGEELLHELQRLKHQLETKSSENQLQVVSESNPVGRFFIGGHFHVSHQHATFRRISQLDALLTLPLSAFCFTKEIERREMYGMLGAARLNPYNGFEYRSLPSWYDLIGSENEIFFQWVEFLLLEPDLPDYRLPPPVVRAYYEGNTVRLKEVSLMYLEELRQVLNVTEKKTSETASKRLERWIDWLKMRERLT